MKKVIFISGGTEAGKTTLALMLHKHFKLTTEILRLDPYVKGFYKEKKKLPAKHESIDGSKAWKEYSTQIMEKLKKDLPDVIESKQTQTWIVEGAYYGAGDVIKDLYPTIHISLRGKDFPQGSYPQGERLLSVDGEDFRVSLKIKHSNHRSNLKALKEGINEADTQGAIDNLLKAVPRLKDFLTHTK